MYELCPAGTNAAVTLSASIKSEPLRLMARSAVDVQGFMGETYNNLRASSSSRKLQAMWPAWTYHNNPFDYELPRYFTI